jgi:hypothetical protein
MPLTLGWREIALRLALSLIAGVRDRSEPGVVSGRRGIVMLYGRWRWTLRSRFVGGGFKLP